MQETIIKYFERFTNQYSQSMFAAKGLEDYSRLRRYCDYLDYDQDSLFRDKKKTPCGPRNIGNTCYLNVILQILYNVNYLREQVLGNQNQKSKFLLHLRSLFGKMSIGKFVYADPTEFFEYLKEAHPNVFIAGVQNDFHQIFTLLLEQLSLGFQKNSLEEGKFLRKLLFGKLSVCIDYGEDKIVKNNQFNIINLQVSCGSLEKALEAWKKTTIEDFMTPKGNKVQAQVQNNFLETPALLTFMINRVSFKNSKLTKDSRVFQFASNVLITKLQSSSQPNVKPKLSKSALEKEKKLVEQKLTLQQWIQKVKQEKEFLIKTLEYLEEKDSPQNIEEPTLNNIAGAEGLQKSKTYLGQQIKQIDRKISDSEAQIKTLEQRIQKISQECHFETYNLWGAMIHEGTSANSGHYKVCIKFDSGWKEYNDRRVTSIGEERMKQYKQRGEICCLFYKRSTLICDPAKNIISSGLKGLVNAQEKEMRMEIDKARLLQSLYQESESANLLLEYQFNFGRQDKFSFFFKPIQYAIKQKFSVDNCKGIIIYSSINNQNYTSNLQKKCISDFSVVEIPKLKLGIPDEYYAASQTLNTFFDKQSTLSKVVEAYLELSLKKIKFDKHLCAKNYNQMLEIIILKGLFYVSLFAEFSEAEMAEKLSNSLSTLLQRFDSSSEFVLVLISIKCSINLKQCKNAKKLNLSLLKKISNYQDYFKEGFKYWIEERSRLSQLDQLTFAKNKILFEFYLMK